LVIAKFPPPAPSPINDTRSEGLFIPYIFKLAPPPPRKSAPFDLNAPPKISAPFPTPPPFCGRVMRQQNCTVFRHKVFLTWIYTLFWTRLVSANGTAI